MTMTGGDLTAYRIYLGAQIDCNGYLFINGGTLESKKRF